MLSTDRGSLRTVRYTEFSLRQNGQPLSRGSPVWNKHEHIWLLLDFAICSGSNLSAAKCHSMNRKEIAQVSDIHRLITSPMSHHKNVQVFLDGLRESLICKNIHALVFVSQSLGCIPIKNSKKLKADYAKALVEWVSNCHHLSSSI